jgi:hypothetical protein
VYRRADSGSWHIADSKFGLEENAPSFADVPNRKSHPGAWPDGLSDELPVFIPVPFTLCWFAIITKQRLAAFQDKAHVRSAGLASVFGFPSG